MSGLESGGTVWRSHDGLLCSNPAGELVTWPPPCSTLPWKQFVGAAVEVISPKSALLSLPKNPLWWNELSTIALPQSSNRQALLGGPALIPPRQSAPAATTSSGGVSVSG